MIFVSGCGSTKVSEEVKVIVPQGNPFIAVGKLVGEENITIENVNGAAGVKAALLSGDYDIVVAPLNLGAQLYSTGNSKYVLDSVIALGNTYIISNKDKQLNTIKDLEGKTILAYSKGGTPDIVLQYVLKENETVLDPCMGVGTTAIACIKSGRNYIGFELCQEYCDIADREINKISQRESISV